MNVHWLKFAIFPHLVLNFMCAACATGYKLPQFVMLVLPGKLVPYTWLLFAAWAHSREEGKEWYTALIM